MTMLNPNLFYNNTTYYGNALYIVHCKSGNFRDNFIFENSVKRHICDAKNLQLGHDLHISVNDRVITAFFKDFIFTKLRICKVS